MLHGSLRGPFSRSRGAPGPAPTQAETTSWQAQVVTNGGAVSAARFTIVNNFIAAEKAAGNWALTDDYWGLWAEDTIGALTSLKQRRLGGSFGAPSFVPSRGYTFDGATNYVNTLFVPSTMAVAMTGTNMRIAVYERSDSAAGHSAGGTNDLTGQNLLILARGGSFVPAFLNSNQANLVLPVATSLGFAAVSRAGSVNANGYKNGIGLTPVALTTPGSALPSFAVFIGARNGSGTAVNFRATSTGLLCVGAPLSATQEQAQYNNVQTWATAIGAQV
jgi:hypothetical protein